MHNVISCPREQWYRTVAVGKDIHPVRVQKLLMFIHRTANSKQYTMCSQKRHRWGRCLSFVIRNPAHLRWPRGMFLLTFVNCQVRNSRRYGRNKKRGQTSFRVTTAPHNHTINPPNHAKINPGSMPSATSTSTTSLTHQRLHLQTLAADVQNMIRARQKPTYVVFLLLSSSFYSFNKCYIPHTSPILRNPHPLRHNK